MTVDATGTFLAIGKAVGGLTLFGPVGLAAALASGKFGDKDLCLAAIEVAKNGGTASGNKKPEEKNGVVNETTGAIGNGVKELFSK